MKEKKLSLQHIKEKKEKKLSLLSKRSDREEIVKMLILDNITIYKELAKK